MAQIIDFAEAAARLRPCSPIYAGPANDGPGEPAVHTAHLPEIARMIRADIRAARRVGLIPEGLRAAVHVREGIAIDIEVIELPAGFRIYDPDFLRWEHERRHLSWLPFAGERLAPEWIDARVVLETIREAYGRRRIDDPYDLRFYGGVSLRWRIEREARRRELGEALFAA